MSPLTKFLLSCLACGVSFLGGGIYGLYVANNQCELEKANFQKSAAETELKAVEKKHELENVYSNAVINAQTGLFDDLRNVNTHFNDLTNNASDLVTDGVHADSSPGNKSMSDNSTAPAGISTTQCKCPKSDRAKLQRLYEQQLVIARDCDITTSYYNRILEIYNSIQQ